MSGDDALWVDLMSAMSSVLGTDDEAIDLATDLLAAIQPHVERADGDAARLRSLAAIYEQPSNRDSTFTFTGRELAAMLEGGRVSEPRRIQLRRTKGWRMPEGAKRVDRTTKWGNWYKVVKVGDRYDERLRDALPDPHALLVVQIDKWGMRTGSQWGGFADKAEATAFAVELHARALRATRADVDGLVHHNFYLGELRGHDLACWCPLDQPCHADVLLELANS